MSTAPLAVSGRQARPRGEPGDRAGMTKVDCAVIVVSYDSAVDVERLLRSLPAAAGRLTTHTVVVENGRGSVELKERLAAHPRVEVVTAPANLGYGGGLNLGLRSAPAARSVLFLNPDLTLDPGSVEELLAAAEQRGAGAAVPLMLDAHGMTSPSLRREPTFLRALGEALLGDRWAGRPGRFAEVVRAPKAYARPSSVEWATGAALLVTAAAVRIVGAWDERFFLYSEEVDFCRRLRAAGAEIRFAPSAVVRHDGAGSGTGPELTALMAVNRVRYYRKHHSTRVALAYATVTALHSVLRAWRPGERLALRALFNRGVRSSLPHRGAV